MDGPHTITTRAKAEGSTSKPAYVNVTQDRKAAAGATGDLGTSQPVTPEEEGWSEYYTTLLLIVVIVACLVGAYLYMRRKRNSTGRPNLFIHNL